MWTWLEVSQWQGTRIILRWSNYRPAGWYQLLPGNSTWDDQTIPTHHITHGLLPLHSRLQNHVPQKGQRELYHLYDSASKVTIVSTVVET